jgi:hypothetical protein
MEKKKKSMRENIQKVLNRQLLIGEAYVPAADN